MEHIEVRTANLKSITIGKLQAKFSVDGTRILRYFIDFWHNDLDLHKELSAPEIYLLQGKVDALVAAWDKKLAEHRKRSAITEGKDAADQMTIEAAARLEALSGILAHTLKVDDRVDWEALKDHGAYTVDPRFLEPKPQRKTTAEPCYQEPDISFWDVLFGRKGRKLAEAKERHETSRRRWQNEQERNAAAFSKEMSEWEARRVAFEAEYAARKQRFLEEQAERNAKVDTLDRGVSTGDQQSIIEHATLVLDKSNYGDLFEKSFVIDYVPDEKTLLIEYDLPSPDNMPTLKGARFIPATGEIRETHISEREQKANFDASCYQICLRTIHEVLEADEHGNIDKVLFNGFTTYVDRTTGRDTTSCIMSVLVNRSDFEAIDLRRVDPKACFKSLKGVSASSLSALAPIPPVMELNKEDRRFIEARSATGWLSEATNLAAIDWEDFEHLVRELFEKEFDTRGGEVKITQASSDGGVDAVAFDPDPITGGKIVIQAKRYTRTVGVSAVRDLFGTMQHESASRGILITTADYGPDAYQFASGKPITLFTGANLLHLLEKHGYKAKIDLREARKELNLRDYR
ncbi:restriction endonuclease [Mesorhizobium sp. WSM4906]|uniref:restriction endonuclease n=1 Tax=Mesorhizobium sp. WSM4906 TaxID=3038546 RepID=UPI00241773B8|nr:restriction endonuclease [Mesorhizobium sp. WSM4906]WFP77339.1 restriction endonuclease [Mesorhizobium sp. WSM4906]